MLSVVSCPDPGQPNHGRRIGNDFLDRMTVNFTCKRPDYDLIGAATVQCTNGKWDKPTPSCKGKYVCCIECTQFIIRYEITVTDLVL